MNGGRVLRAGGFGLLLTLAGSFGDFSESAAAAGPAALICGTDQGRYVDHLGGNHRFGPQDPHHHTFGLGHFGHHHPHPHQPKHDFVRRAGSRLFLGGDEFRFAGANNYYSAYKSEFMVDDVLGDADDQGFTVLRTWAFIDIGQKDGSGSIQGKADGAVYYHYLNDSAPAFNDGPDGLQHLDYVVFKASQLGIKLVLPLTNNWSDFGGMDQYVAWAGDQFHDQFYTDPKIRGWYKDWVAHILDHKNPYTGIKLKDDPTIMTWELANEPRCGGSGVYPRSTTCSATTITSWANEMSTFIKRLDDHHLVSVGDEGFYCIPGAPNFIDRCDDGVDTLALTRLPNIDVMSFHLYPDGWGQTVEWGQEFIERHFADALALHKPAMLGEFGLVDKTLRNPNYKLWTDTAFQVGGNGALYWMLAGVQDDGTLYPDADGFTVYCPSPVCSAYSHFSAMMTADRELPFAPVADDDVAQTHSGQGVVLTPIVNDVAYNGAMIVPGSIDLDPVTAGQQLTLAVTGGTLEARADGSVEFTAAAGFVGEAHGTYTVSDDRGRVSGAAELVVTVASPAGAPRVLYSFETGTDGWQAASFNASAGTTSSSTDFATDGTHSLRIAPTGGGWFGIEFSTPIDLSDVGEISWDVKTTGSPSSQEIAIVTGDDFQFCSPNTFPFIAANTTTTLSADLTALACDFSKVHAIYVFGGNGGPDPIYIDDVRALSAPPPLFSFETGVEGWAPASFNPSAGTVEQSADYATDGSFSLKVTPSGSGGWFGREYSAPISLAGKTHVKWDLKTTGSPTSTELALQVGDAFTFCTGGTFPFVNADTTATLDVDLTALDCGVTDLSSVHNLYVFLGNAGTDPIYLDNLRAE